MNKSETFPLELKILKNSLKIQSILIERKKTKVFGSSILNFKLVSIIIEEKKSKIAKKFIWFKIINPKVF